MAGAWAFLGGDNQLRFAVPIKKSLELVNYSAIISGYVMSVEDLRVIFRVYIQPLFYYFIFSGDEIENLESAECTVVRRLMRFIGVEIFRIWDKKYKFLISESKFVI